MFTSRKFVSRPPRFSSQPYTVWALIKTKYQNVYSQGKTKRIWCRGAKGKRQTWAREDGKMRGTEKGKQRPSLQLKHMHWFFPFHCKKLKSIIQSPDNYMQKHLLDNPWKTITSNGIGPFHLGYQICGHRVVHKFIYYPFNFHKIYSVVPLLISDISNLFSFFLWLETHLFYWSSQRTSSLFHWFSLFSAFKFIDFSSNYYYYYFNLPTWDLICSFFPLVS